MNADEELEIEMAKLKAGLRGLVGPALARAGGNARQALVDMSKEIQQNPRLREKAERLGLLCAIRDEQTEMRNAATSSQLDRFVSGKTPPNDWPDTMKNVDLDAILGRYRYPLHKSGLYIGLATEENIVESIHEIDRQLGGLQSARDFEDAVLAELRKKRKKKSARVFEVLSEERVDELWGEYKRRTSPAA